MVLANAQTNTGAKTFATGTLISPDIVGGTAVGSNIIYKSTTGVGTTAGIAHQFVGGTNGATVAATILNNGNVGIGVTNPTIGALQVSGGQSFTTIPTNTSAIGTMNSTTGWSGQGFLFSTGANNSFSMVWNGSAAYFGNVTNTAQTPWYVINGTGLSIGSGVSVNKLDVSGGAAFGTYGGVNTAPTNGIIVSGNVGIGTTSPSAVLHLKAGTATAGTGPIKLTSGTLLTTAEAGAIEFLTDAYHATITTGAARRTFAFLESPTFTGTVTIPTGASITTPVLTGIPTGSGVASAATASTLASRDANGNISADSILQGYTTTATAAGTTTLTVNSTYLQFFTGSTTQTLVLPVASTLVLGQQFYIRNNSTGAVTIQSSGTNVVRTLAGNTRAIVTCILASGTDATSWSAMYVGISIADGKILTASNTLTLAGTDGTTQTFQASDTIVGRATTDTLTNKRNQPRTNSTTTAGTLAPDLGTANVYYRTTQTETLTISAPIGTPIIGETLSIYVDSVAAQTLTINSTYKAFGSAFPATTTAGKTFMMVCQFNGTDWKTTHSSAI